MFYLHLPIILLGVQYRIFTDLLFQNGLGILHVLILPQQSLLLLLSLLPLDTEVNSNVPSGALMAQVAQLLAGVLVAARAGRLTRWRLRHLELRVGAAHQSYGVHTVRSLAVVVVVTAVHVAARCGVVAVASGRAVGGG